ncbi:uncharacterized protein LOC108665015 [Hyalella azteca]|uniref:Uncharacterized protein LOC108665015 n=1 Tax=Hyalella azteca TaxID=294128 RepID=A0A8B7N0Z2_HYAAZ|nr:uncharacterized protein LOC108665015 [Hyalella azteca]
MTSLWRMLLMAAVAVQVSLYHTAETRRLLLGEDGFARVDGPSTSPVSGITVSSWVNVTEFPGGVAPLVTIISEDASYQIAFFLRHDGAGVLWGGPKPQQLSQVEQVDRQPRSRFGSGRKRRNANDYSMGLGDVINIMSPRKERSNTWTPMNFVDVSEMGVADLETSGSETQNHYENWYDVGYELQMQESANPEPKIITQPSGKNDFVVINWNGHNAPPLSTNQWDPLNEDPKSPDFTNVNVGTKILPPDNEKFIWSQEDNTKNGGWVSQVQPITANVPSSTIIQDFVALHTTEPTTRARPSRPFIPDLRRPGSRDSSKTVRPTDAFRYSQRKRTEAPATVAKMASTTTSTTTSRPVQVKTEKKETESRVPLWARLKQTSEEESVASEIPILTTTRAPRPRTTTRAPITHATSTETSRPTFARTTTPSPLRKIQVPSVISTKPPTPATQQQTTKSTSTKSKERKAYNNLNSKGPFSTKHNSEGHRPITSHSLDEFKKVLEGKPKIEDNGNKVVVYSMPITDVDAFNRMYEQYQESVARQSPRVNLHAVYDLAREGYDHPALNEEETNQNRLEQIPEPLPVLTYKEEPLRFAESEPAPIIIKETDIEEPVLAIEEIVPEYEETDFPPSELGQIGGAIAGDFAYYPYEEATPQPQVLKKERPQRTKTRFEMRVPAGPRDELLAGLRFRPTVYETAMPVQQDISGQQESFYQEPSRISHEQLPPEYSEKSESKNRFAPERPAQIQKTRVVQEVQNIPKNIRSELIPPQSLPMPIHNEEQVRNAAAFIERNNNVPALQEIRTTEGTPTPIKINAVPIFAEDDVDIVTEVPLNVNFRKMPYNFDLNTWYHLAFTWSSQDHVLSIYINGQLAGILENTIPDVQALPTNGMMLLGKTLLPSLTGFDPTSHVTGEMSNFVVWGSALSPMEINNVFSCGEPPIHPVLLAWNSTPLRVYNDAVLQQAPPICGISS